MGLRKRENRSGCSRWSFVGHPFESSALLLTASIRRTAHPRFTLCDAAMTALLPRGYVVPTKPDDLFCAERERHATKCRRGRGYLYLIGRSPPSSFSPRYGYVSNVLAKQELHVDRGMNRGESWDFKGARGASDILKSVTGLPKSRK